MKVSILAAITVDGKLARDAAHFPDWTGKEDKQLFRSITLEAGVMVMGSRTFATIGKPLPGRQILVMTRDPAKNSSLENVSYTTESPPNLVRRLSDTGHRHLIVAGGAMINTLFLEQGLVDELLLTFCPLAFGSGVSLFSAPIDLALDLVSTRQLQDGSLFARYRCRRG